jgi:sulfite reductase alpha subunit-like flavoprotein
MPGLFPIAGCVAGRPQLVEALLINRGDDASGIVDPLERGKLGVGDSLPIFVHTNVEGRLPEDPTRPAILVATGASMACAAFFLGERSQTLRSGRNWLFTCTMEDSGLAPYSGRIAVWQASRVLTRLDVSATPSLTERILAQAEMLRAWLVDGCVLYFFGSDAECDERAAVFARVLGRSTAGDDAHSWLDGLRAHGQLRIVVTE